MTADGSAAGSFWEGKEQFRNANVPECNFKGRWSMMKNQPESAMSARERRAALSPAQDKAFREFSRAVFADGALPRKTKELIAVAVAHVTQCPYCIRGHTKSAKRHGATSEEILEAIWVASEMRAGAAVAHSALAFEALDEAEDG